jgi:exodeoxyribonuclease VII small subunit
MTTETETFKGHFGNLQQVANQLRTQDEPDLDTLVPMVDSALKSYKFCKDRIASVEAMLNERLGAGE